MSCWSQDYCISLVLRTFIWKGNADHRVCFRQRLRTALELEHMCTFFVANAYYQLKIKECPAAAEENQDVDKTIMSDTAKDLEQREESYYEGAKLLRKELLTDPQKKADVLISKVKDKISSLIHIPSITPIADPGGIQVRTIFERVEATLATLQGQTAQLLIWRSKAVELLTTSLVDEEETDLKGDEYEISTKQQDEVYVYVDVLGAIVADRHEVLTGQENFLINRDVKTLFREAKEGKGHSPQLTLQLLARRQDLKPENDVGSVRSLITELRELKTNLRGSVERYNARAAAESVIVHNLLQQLHQISNEQTKVSSALDKEVELFKDTMNLRLEYYRQLQAISDTVAPFEEEMSEEARNDVLSNKQQAESRLKARITTLKSKARYLVHLRDEAMDTQSPRMCIICTSPFENGILTSCGHTYCTECLRLWWGQRTYIWSDELLPDFNLLVTRPISRATTLDICLMTLMLPLFTIYMLTQCFPLDRSCPSCKKHLSRSDLHQITYKPKDLTIEEEESSAVDTVASDADDKADSIYSGECILNKRCHLWAIHQISAVNFSILIRCHI